MADLDPSDLANFAHSPHSWLMTLARNLPRIPAWIAYVRNPPPLQAMEQATWQGVLKQEKDPSRVARTGFPVGRPFATLGEAVAAPPLGAIGPLGTAGIGGIGLAGVPVYPVGPPTQVWTCDARKHDWKTPEDAVRCCKHDYAREREYRRLLFMQRDRWYRYFWRHLPTRREELFTEWQDRLVFPWLSSGHPVL